VADRIKLRRDTAANWTATNPVLAQGEPGFETDTDFLKVGDGVTAWNALGYVAGVGAFVAKTGDTMTGPLSVPAGASGAQVPQAQEIGTLANAQLTTHYKRSNILGTVSQSGGVPTGAVIETGSNANGTYIKYADGTLICSKQTTRYSTTSAEAGFYGGDVASQNFAHAFVAAPIVTLTAANSSGSGCWATNAVSTTTGVGSVRMYAAISGASALVNILAIGRWF